MSVGSSPLITAALNDKLQPRRRATNHPQLPVPSSTRHYGIVPEESFRKSLSLEQKRTERSSKPFLLMLLEGDKLFQTDRRQRALQNILSSLSSSVRETDITGWFKENFIVGVIFTEVGSVDAATEAILKRVVTTLRQNLSSEEVDSIDITLHVFPDKWDEKQPGPPARLDMYPDLREQEDFRRVDLVLKRIMDVVGSLIALILLSPLFALIAALIKLTSRGPVFFRQTRVGQYGEKFTFLKFRTMDARNNSSIHKDYVRRFISGKAYFNEGEHGQSPVYKLVDDTRVTRVGRFLRRSSLDELPQLLNVLKGEMSLVGPRPPIPYECDDYELWHRRRLLEAKPGITGLWQVNGRSKTTFDDMVRLDLRYARSWSLWLDIKILLKTPQAVLSREGAY
jgi:lipopolysaccharide/colanic/teichoic acid biosynthesis glycosyltransferase